MTTTRRHSYADRAAAYRRQASTARREGRIHDAQECEEFARRADDRFRTQR